MNQEIEVKFLNVDVEDIRAKLTAAHAELEHPMRLMRRDQLDHEDQRFRKDNFSERLRIRDEGDKLTVTYKKYVPDSPYPIEIETTVGSYENIKDLLKAIGFSSYSYQESRRETWLLGDVEVVIDEWPWLKPYIEIEGPSEDSIKAVAATLGFDWANAVFGTVETAYMAQYPKMTVTDTIGDIGEIRFDQPLPLYLQERM